MENREKILSIFFASLAPQTAPVIPSNAVESHAEEIGVEQGGNMKYDSLEDYQDIEIPSSQPKNIIETNDGAQVVVEEEMPFPYEELDFPKLAEYSLFSIENITNENIVKTKEDTVLYMIPLDLNQEVLEEGDVKQFVVKPGMNFEIAQNRVLINSRGDFLEVSILANTFGGKNYVAAIVSNAVIDGERTEFVANNSNQIESTSTYIVVEDTAYPNKISNLLKAFAHITQEGQLRVGEEYSFLSITGVDNINRLVGYDLGRTDLGSVVYAGGVCAAATGVASVLSQVDGIQIVERWTHSNPYAQGPYSSRWVDVDAAVNYNSQTKEVYDLRWNMQRDGYIEVDVELLPSGVSYADTDRDGLGNVSDVCAIFSVSFTEEEPLGQEEVLWYLREEYKTFRDTQHKGSWAGQESRLAESYEQTWDVKRSVNLLYLLKSPERFGVLKGRNRGKYKYFNLE